jgi:hypothetical protein
LEKYKINMRWSLGLREEEKMKDIKNEISLKLPD